jgi:hypothetical protein
MTLAPPKRTPNVQTPGAASDTAAGAQEGDQHDPQGDESGGVGPDPKDAEIARLRAQLAALQSPAAAGDAMVIEGIGPHNRQKMAESKHAHLTAIELHDQVASGKVRLTERAVLCKDGWYANPYFEDDAARASNLRRAS